MYFHLSRLPQKTYRLNLWHCNLSRNHKHVYMVWYISAYLSQNMRQHKICSGILCLACVYSRPDSYINHALHTSYRMIHQRRLNIYNISSDVCCNKSSNHSYYIWYGNVDPYTCMYIFSTYCICRPNLVI